MIKCMVCCFTVNELLPANSPPNLLMLTLHDGRNVNAQRCLGMYPKNVEVAVSRLSNLPPTKLAFPPTGGTTNAAVAHD